MCMLCGTTKSVIFFFLCLSTLCVLADLLLCCSALFAWLRLCIFDEHNQASKQGRNLEFEKLCT